MSMQPFNIPTIHESLYNDYKAGRLTLAECAEELHEAGWTNFVDTKYTQRKFNEIANKLTTAPTR